MGQYDIDTATLYNGARGLYNIGKQGAKKFYRAAKEIFTPKHNTPSKTASRTQNLETPPKTQAQKNEEYRNSMDKQYGSTLHNNIAGVFGFPKDRR